MPDYRYQAHDADDQPVEGTLSAENADAAREQLAARGLRDAEITQLDTSAPKAKSLTSSEVTELSHGLAELADREFPLAPGLRAMAEDLDTGRLRGVLNTLAGDLERGTPLEDAIESTGGLPEHLRQLILAGQRSGKLGQVLHEYVLRRQKILDMQRRLWNAMVYPLGLAVMALGLTLFVLFVFVPQFAEIFKDYGTDLPMLTAWLVLASRYFQWLATGAVGGLLLVACFWRFALSTRVRRRLIHAMPLLGPIYKWTAWSAFAHLAALLLDAEVPLPEAFRLAGGGANDADVQAAAEEVAAAVEAGQPLSHSEVCRQQFPAVLQQLAGWGQQQNTLSETLRTIAELFEERADMQAGMALLITPLIGVLIVIAIVGITLVALLLPMFMLFEMLI